MRIPAGTFVLVEWEDIQSAGDWNEDPETVDTATIQMPGWVAEDYDKRYRKLVLAQSKSVDEDTVHDHTAIPTGCVISIKTLESGQELFDLGGEA